MNPETFLEAAGKGIYYFLNVQILGVVPEASQRRAGECIFGKGNCCEIVKNFRTPEEAIFGRRIGTKSAKICAKLSSNF